MECTHLLDHEVGGVCLLPTIIRRDKTQAQALDEGGVALAQVRHGHDTCIDLPNLRATWVHSVVQCEIHCMCLHSQQQTSNAIECILRSCITEDLGLVALVLTGHSITARKPVLASEISVLAIDT